MARTVMQQAARRPAADAAGQWAADAAGQWVADAAGQWAANAAAHWTGEAAPGAALDRRTRALASLAVAAALRLEGRLAACVAEARAAGAARGEVVGAILAGLPDAGPRVLAMVPPALQAFDEPYRRGQD